MNISLLLVIAVIGFIDLAGRIAALMVLMNSGSVKRLKYRTWVLLCIFVNFAWLFYFIMGRGKDNV